MSETEIDRLFETLQPSFGHLTPAFENFLGGLWRKVKSVASGAINLAKKGIAAVGKIIPLGWIFDKLKGLIRPLLKRVLQYALSRLPASLQPYANKLANKLFGETGETSETELEMPTGVGEALAHPDPDATQREFDARAASLFFARDEAEQEAIASEAAGEAEQTETDRFAELDTAREAFVRDIVSLPRGQDPTAQMENFLPAVMAALKIGVTIIGRQRVVGFLAGYLAKLITPYVGREVAKPLSDAIVSAGMGLVGLEVPAEREMLAGEAIANAVEGTVRRVAEQGEHVFEDQRLLEAAIQEAFAEAASESFPPEMIRESLHEVSAKSAVTGTWVLRPAKGRRRYKRYTRVIDVTISRQIGDAVEGFGCLPLNEFLRARFGVSTPVRAKAYLFEAICGTTVSAIARLEKGIPGLGPGVQKGWKLFIPLTRQAAGALFGEPDLGRDVATQFLMSPHRIVVGQRLVVLIPEGVRPPSPVPPYPGPQPHPAPQPKPNVIIPGRGRPSEVNLTLDFPASQIRTYIYLSERDAQAVAQSIRRGESATPAIILVRNIYVATLRSMLSGNARKHVKVVHEAAAQEQWVGAVLGVVGKQILQKLLDKLLAWVDQAISEYLARRRQEFVAEADKKADGVTIIVVHTHNTVMAALRKVLKGDTFGAGLALTKALIAPVSVSIKTVAGFR